MKNPKVFLYGVNWASVINSLAIGFRKINVPVRALSFDFDRSIYNNYSEIECICTDNHPGKLKIFYYKIKGFMLLIRNLMWCDIIHIYGTKTKFHYWLISKLVRKKFVTFLGSEIRMPEKEYEINPYYKLAFENSGYENKEEAKNNPDDVVSYLAKHNYGFIMWDTETFINRNLTNKIAIVPHPSHNGSSITDTSPLEQDKVLMIHSPTAPVAKGTTFVLDAINKLKSKNLPFEFKLLRNIPNSEYQTIIARADIYIDQFMWGAYGIAAQQAMQMGKVVVAYIAPVRLRLFGNDFPIQNATIENLADVLENLITNSSLRKEISKKSRAYYEKMHKPEVVARKMLATYEDLSN